MTIWALKKLLLKFCLAQAPLWDGWSHLGFRLNSNNGKKKDLCNLCIDGLLFDLIEIRALFNKSFVLVSNQETNATSSDVGSKLIKSYFAFPQLPLAFFFFSSRRFLSLFGLHPTQSILLNQSGAYEPGQSQIRSVHYHHSEMRA